MSQVLTPPKTDQREAAALAWCQEFGYEGSTLPRGRRFGPDCPLANATGMLVGVGDAGNWTFDTETGKVGLSIPVYGLPPLVEAFRHDFDAGRYSHLDSEAGE